MPTVDVLLPVFNAGHRLNAAVSSIVAQTLQDWQLTLIDDGSTDDSREMIEHWTRRDDRIVSVVRDANRGPGSALNSGALCTTAPLLAIMHADDIAAPSRLELQYCFMSANPGIDVLGSAAVYLDHSDRPCAVVRPPRTHEEILSNIDRRTPFVHSTVMMRRSFLSSVGGYAQLYRGEDADLWFKGAGGHKYHNLQDALMIYRMPHRHTLKSAARRALAHARGLHRVPMKRSKIVIGVLRSSAAAFRSVAYGSSGAWLKQPPVSEHDLRHVADCLP